MKKFIPVIISSLIFSIYFIWQIYSISENNSGKFIYPLDDTYIHLSIAKNLAISHNFGITSHEFSSTSSSPLYTLLIALIISIFGNSDLIPLYINYFASIAIFFVLTSIFLKKYNIPIVSILVFVTALFLPICILAISGMEHLLQILINLLIFNRFFNTLNYDNSRIISPNYGNSNSKTKSHLFESSTSIIQWFRINSGLLTLFLLSALTTSIRYEGIFLIFLFMLMTVLKKENKLAVGIFVSALIPLMIYGIFSTFHGSYFFPNSVLFKSTRPKMNFYGLIIYSVSWIYKLIQNPHLLSIFLLLVLNLIINIKNNIKINAKVNHELLFVISLFIIHLTLARIGWVYRYETYCIALGLVVLIKNMTFLINNIPKKLIGYKNFKIAYILLLAIAIIPLIQRTYLSFSETKLMTQNIYQQQYQMARFLKLYYNDSKVVLNDIGASTYYTNIYLIDINSLGSIETLKMRIKDTFDKQHIFELTSQKDYDIAILYKESYHDYIPDQWIETAKLIIPNNIGCAYDNVTFYAVKPNKYNDLKKNLSEFKQLLPNGVKLLIY